MRNSAKRYARKIIDGRSIAGDIITDLKKQRKKIHFKPGLCVINAGSETSKDLYLLKQKKTAEELGVYFSVRNFPPRVSFSRIFRTIRSLNADRRVHGIFLPLPLPAGLPVSLLQSSIAPRKDVEGVHPENIGRLLLGETGAAPVTAGAVMEILMREKIDLTGKEAVVVGHSPHVGKPIVNLLLSSSKKAPTVTCCHISTRNLGFHTRRADILITAAGKPGLITGKMVKKGAVVIDVGISRSGRAGSISGDVLFSEAVRKAGRITPVPGGVGPVTTALLFRKLFQTCLCRK